MSQVFHVVLPMEPQQKGRPSCGCRKAGHQVFPYAYTDTDARRWMKEAASRLSGERNRRGWRKLDGPIRVTIVFVRGRPSGRIRTNKDRGRFELCSLETWKAGGRFACHAKPDADNYAKAALDAISKAGLWHDDGQVASLTLMKFYAAKGEPPSVEIRLEPM